MAPRSGGAPKSARSPSPLARGRQPQKSAENNRKPESGKFSSAFSLVFRLAPNLQRELKLLAGAGAAGVERCSRAFGAGGGLRPRLARSSREASKRREWSAPCVVKRNDVVRDVDGVRREENIVRLSAHVEDHRVTAFRSRTCSAPA